MNSKMIFVYFLVIFLALVQADGYKKCEKMVSKCESCPKMNHLLPFRDFDESKFLGTWYSVRWYLPLMYTLEDDEFSYTHTFYTKEGAPENMIFFDINARDIVNSAYCMDIKTTNSTRIRPGIYHVAENAWGETYTGTVLWTDNQFAVEIYCYDKQEGDQCDDLEVFFWSRTKKADKKYFKKGEEILKKICFPTMKRFLDDVKHDIDCLPGDRTKIKCSKSK